MAFATVLIAVTGSGSVDVLLAQEGDEEQDGQETGTAAEEEEAPSPILPIGKEMIWGFGSFLVLLALMRLVFIPKMKSGMDARAQKVAADLAAAEEITAAAEAEMAEYRTQVAAIRAEGQSRIDAARATVDGERQARLGEVNARLGQQRAEGAAQAEATKQAAMGQIADAVAEVTSVAAARVLGREVPAASVRSAVDAVMQAGVPG